MKPDGVDYMIIFKIFATQGEYSEGAAPFDSAWYYTENASHITSPLRKIEGPLQSILQFNSIATQKSIFAVMPGYVQQGLNSIHGIRFPII